MDNQDLPPISTLLSSLEPSSRTEHIVANTEPGGAPDIYTLFKKVPYTPPRGLLGFSYNPLAEPAFLLPSPSIESAFWAGLSSPSMSRQNHAGTVPTRRSSGRRSTSPLPTAHSSLSSQEQPPRRWLVESNEEDERNSTTGFIEEDHPATQLRSKSSESGSLALRKRAHHETAMTSQSAHTTDFEETARKKAKALDLGSESPGLHVAGQITVGPGFRRHIKVYRLPDDDVQEVPIKSEDSDESTAEESEDVR